MSRELVCDSPNHLVRKISKSDPLSIELLQENSMFVESSGLGILDSHPGLA